jgi:hypothetical protein
LERLLAMRFQTNRTSSKEVRILQFKEIMRTHPSWVFNNQTIEKIYETAIELEKPISPS